MSEHRYHVDGYSAGPPEVVFDVLVDGPGWADVGAGPEGGVLRVRGEPAPHGVGAIRRFGAGRGPVSREQVVAYERPGYFSYVSLSGPLPWHDYRAEVRLTPGPAGVGTTIDWTGSFQQSGAGSRHVHPPHGRRLRHGAGGRVRAARRRPAPSA